MASERRDDRLDELERRVRQVETRLGIERLDLRDEISDAAAVDQGAALEVPPIVGPLVEEAPETGAAPNEGQVFKQESPPRVEPSGWREIHRRPAPSNESRSVLDLERTIGARWFAAAGAVVVVIGVGLFLKLAIERGWMDLIPPAWKCVSGALFGALLLSAGEVIRRRLGALASAGVSAAGLGALFASVYAAYGVYHLVPPGAAFGMLAAVAILGFGVAAVGRLASIAVLSLVAAYVNPIIIGDTGVAPLMLPGYLFALLCLGLALSAWRAGPFRLLRGLVWWGTLVFGTLWTWDQGLTHPGPALAFFAGCWTVLHAELALSARRSVRLEAAVELPWPAVRFVATSFSTTVWAVALAVHVLRRGTAVGDWLAPAVAAAITAILAAGLAGRLGVLRDVPRTDAERLGAGLAMQAGALIMAAIALGLSGWMEAVAWLSLGVAAVGTGRWIRSRGLDVYGVVALVVATGRLLFVDSPPLTTPVEIGSLAGLVITRWTLLMAAGGAAWAGASVLLRRQTAPPGARDPWKAGARGALITGLCHLNLSLLSPGADTSSVAVAWLGLGLVGLALARWLASPGLAGYGTIVLGLSTLRFMLDAPIVRPGSSPGHDFAGIVIGRWMYLMLGAAAAWGLGAAAAPVWSRSDVSSRVRPFGVAALVLAITLVNLSIVHPAADAGSVCIAWLLLGLVGLLLGRGLRSVALVAYGVITLAAASARFLWGSPLTGAPAAILAEGLGLIVTRWTVLMLGGAAAWLFGAALMREEQGESAPGRLGHPRRTALIAIGVSMVCLAALDPRAQAGSIAIVWLGVGVVCVLLHGMVAGVALDLIGLIVMVLAAAAWTVAYPFDWMQSGAPLGAHAGLLSSAVIAGVGLGAKAWLGRVAGRARATDGRVLAAIVPALLSLLFVSTSLEVARIASTLSEPTARKAAVSIWWGVAAVAMILAGFIRHTPLARHTGLVLLTIATGKALAIDLQEVPKLWRVASLVGLGLLMLGVAVGYAKASSLLRHSPTREGPR